MGKVLIVAEKPSVARDIAKVCGCTKKGDGFLYSDTHIVSWAIGHLITLAEPEDYDIRYKKWKLETLPVIPNEMKLKALPKTKTQLSLLKKIMSSKEIDGIICATDSGREGELIFRYIYKYAECDKPVKRLWISSMTDAAINAGLAAMKDGKEYDRLYQSAKCRSEADWLVGINATRAFTTRYDALLSIGRVQTPTLAIIVARQKEIDAFVPSDYYEIIAAFSPGYEGKWFDPLTNETRIAEKDKANGIAAKVKGKNAVVESVETEEKKQLHPLLYDLTELQRDCNRRFGYPAAKTLSIAQDLYEKRKLITYPRTDSRHLSQDMVPKLAQALRRLEKTEIYKPYADYVLALEKLPVTKRIADDSKVTDHHAIIPTDTVIRLDSLSADERNVYDMIARRFLSVFYPPYEYLATKIITLSEGESFVTRGTTITNLGWNELYKNDKTDKSEKDEEPELPKLAKGDVGEVTKVSADKKKTKPPAAYTEASLLSAMENAGRDFEDEELKEQMKDSGLGTPATRAAIIERLLAVGYLTRKGKALVATEKGMKLIEIVPAELKSAETTGKWERGLANIQKGTMDTERFMASIKRYVSFIVNTVRTSELKADFPKTETARKPKSGALCKCPFCGSDVFENTKAYYCGGWKSGCKMSIWKDSLSKYRAELTPKLAKELLTMGKASGVAVVLPDVLTGKLADVSMEKELPVRLTVYNIRNAEDNNGNGV